MAKKRSIAKELGKYTGEADTVHRPKGNKKLPERHDARYATIEYYFNLGFRTALEIAEKMYGPESEVLDAPSAGDARAVKGWRHVERSDRVAEINRLLNQLKAQRKRVAKEKL